MPVFVQKEPLDPTQLMQEYFPADHKIGAIVNFTGLVREFCDQSESSEKQTLTLEHYPGMTEKMLQKTLDLACGRWALHQALIAHRYGEMELGETIVFVAASATHRKEAFEACHFMIDWLKTQAPFWKLERSSEQEYWVQERSQDQEQARRWSQTLSLK